MGLRIGLCTTASTYSAFANDGTAGVMVNLATGTLYLNGGSGSALAPTPSTGSVIGLAIDLDNRKSWMRLAPSGNWNNSGCRQPGSEMSAATRFVAGSMVCPVVTFGGAGGTANNVDTANFRRVLLSRARCRQGSRLAGRRDRASKTWVRANADATVYFLIAQAAALISGGAWGLCRTWSTWKNRVATLEIEKSRTWPRVNTRADDVGEDNTRPTKSGSTRSLRS